MGFTAGITPPPAPPIIFWDLHKPKQVEGVETWTAGGTGDLILCQHSWATVTRELSNNILMSLYRCSLDEINIEISGLWDKQIILHKVGGPNLIS